jgi:hypothetical protein
MKTQLLCTFTNKDNLTDVLREIRETYNVCNLIYVFSNKKDREEIFITYNVENLDSEQGMLENTISVHRKKESNTIYTINALNQMVKDQNGGVLDKTFILDWQKYKNSIVLTNLSGLRVIPISIFDIIKLSEE